MIPVHTVCRDETHQEKIKIDENFLNEDCWYASPTWMPSKLSPGHTWLLNHMTLPQEYANFRRKNNNMLTDIEISCSPLKPYLLSAQYRTGLWCSKNFWNNVDRFLYSFSLCSFPPFPIWYLLLRKRLCRLLQYSACFEKEKHIDLAFFFSALANFKSLQAITTPALCQLDTEHTLPICSVETFNYKKKKSVGSKVLKKKHHLSQICK